MLKQQKFWMALVTVSIATLVLTACVPYGSTSSIQETKSTQARPLASKRTLIKKLEASEVQVVELGDHLRIILPTHNFFDVEKSELQESAEPILILVAKLIALYDGAPVFIQGYTHNIGYEAENVRRSTHQANDVAAVLWSYGIDHQRMRIQGYGSKFPIADNKSVVGREMNCRIEIQI